MTTHDFYCEHCAVVRSTLTTTRPSPSASAAAASHIVDVDDHLPRPSRAAAAAGAAPAPASAAAGGPTLDDGDPDHPPARGDLPLGVGAGSGGAASAACQHKWVIFYPKTATASTGGDASPGPGVGNKRKAEDIAQPTSSVISRHKIPLDFKIEDPLGLIVEHPIDAAKAAKLIESGSMVWIGDTNAFPTLLADRKADDPYAVITNLETFRSVQSIRMLAQALNTATLVAEAPAATGAGAAATHPDDTQLDIRDQEDADRDPKFSDIFLNARDNNHASPFDCIETAFCQAVMALGSKARRLRTAHGSRSARLDDTTEVKVRDSKDPSKFINYIKFGDLNSALDLVSDTAKLNKSGFLISLSDVKDTPDFVIGASIAAAGFDPSASLRDLWRAVDDADTVLRDAVKKARPEDAKAAREAAKDAKDASRRKEQAEATAKALAAAVGRNRGGAPVTQKAGTTTTTTTADGDQEAGGGGNGPANTASGGPRAAATRTQRQTFPKRADVLALQPEKRSNRVCRRYKLCMKCRQEGHLASACKNAEVKFVP